MKAKRDFEEENNKIFLVVKLAIVLLILVAFLLGQPWRQRGCLINEKNIYVSEFSGRVVHKFIDHPNHAAETVEFSSNQTIALLRGEYYENIEIGDSIHKVKNSFRMEIHKKDGSMEMIYKLPCEEEGFLNH